MAVAAGYAKLHEAEGVAPQQNPRTLPGSLKSTTMSKRSPGAMGRRLHGTGRGKQTLVAADHGEGLSVRRATRR